MNNETMFFSTMLAQPLPYNLTWFNNSTAFTEAWLNTVLLNVITPCMEYHNLTVSPIIDNINDEANYDVFLRIISPFIRVGMGNEFAIYIREDKLTTEIQNELDHIYEIITDRAWVHEYYKNSNTAYFDASWCHPYVIDEHLRYDNFFEPKLHHHSRTLACKVIMYACNEPKHIKALGQYLTKNVGKMVNYKMTIKVTNDHDHLTCEYKESDHNRYEIKTSPKHMTDAIAKTKLFLKEHHHIHDPDVIPYVKKIRIKKKK